MEVRGEGWIERGIGERAHLGLCTATLGLDGEACIAPALVSRGFSGESWLHVTWSSWVNTGEATETAPGTPASLQIGTDDREVLEPYPALPCAAFKIVSGEL